jgi:hypothetical protein
MIIFMFFPTGKAQCPLEIDKVSQIIPKIKKNNTISILSLLDL